MKEIFNIKILKIHIQIILEDFKRNIVILVCAYFVCIKCILKYFLVLFIYIFFEYQDNNTIHYIYEYYSIIPYIDLWWCIDIKLKYLYICFYYKFLRFYNISNTRLSYISYKSILTIKLNLKFFYKCYCLRYLRL